MPEPVSLLNFSNYKLPVFPTDTDAMTITNDLIPDIRFGKIEIHGAVPYTYYFFGNLDKEKIAGSAFLCSNLMLSHGMQVVKPLPLWKAVNGTTGNLMDAINFAEMDLVDIGTRASNRLIPICWQLVDQEALINNDPELDFWYHPFGLNLPPAEADDTPVVVGGGNGICTKVVGNPFTGSPPTPQNQGRELDRVVFAVRATGLPDAGAAGRLKPEVRMRALCKVKLKDHLVEGYFVMPQICPDLSVIHYAYPNLIHAHHTGLPSEPKVPIPEDVCPTKSVLKRWFALPEGLIVGVDSLMIEAIEEMHTFFCSDVHLLPIPTSN